MRKTLIAILALGLLAPHSVSAETGGTAPSGTQGVCGDINGTGIRCVDLPKTPASDSEPNSKLGPGHLLTFTTWIEFSECKTTYDSPYTTVAGCVSSRYPDLDFMSTASMAECKVLGPELAMRKWNAANRLGWKLPVTWSCD